jgi:long-chain acyl-CoA synthetase
MEREVLGECETLARFEKPKRVGLLEHEFSVERGELTPTLKVKRRVVDKSYKSLIDTLYDEEKELVSTG